MPRQPLIARLPTDPSPATQLRDPLLASLVLHDDPHPLVHSAGRPPRHRSDLPTELYPTCHPCHRSILLPLYSVYTPPAPLRRGEGSQCPPSPLSAPERGWG